MNRALSILSPLPAGTEVLWEEGSAHTRREEVSFPGVCALARRTPTARACLPEPALLQRRVAPRSISDGESFPERVRGQIPSTFHQQDITVTSLPPSEPCLCLL